MINDLDMQGWAYLLAPTFQFVNTAGKPLTEGYLEVYIAGTRNKYYCASDFNGTLHPFQIPLDSLGSNIVLADPSQAYDVYAYNRFGSLVMSRYNVSPSNAGGSGVLTITISSNDDTVQVVQDGNNYDLSIADTVARIDDIEDRLDNIGDGSVGYAIAHSELASDGLFELTNDKNKDIDYTGDMHGFRLKPGHVYQLNFNAKFDCNNDTNKLISGKFYIDGNNVVSQEWQFNVDNSFEHQESFNGSTVLVIPEDVSYYDVKLKYLFDDEALDLYLNKISIVDVTSIVSQGASGEGVYTEGDGIIIVDNSISVDMDYINEHLEIDASSILSSAYNYTDARVSQASGDLINIIAEATGNIPMPEQVQSDWNQDDDTQVDYIKNKPDLDIYATHDELETTVTNVVSSVSSVLHNEIENIDLSSYATHDEVNTAITNASGDIINYVDNSIDNVTNVIESVSGDLQAQIGNIPEQVNADWNSNSGKSEILNKPNLSIYATHNEVSGVSGNIINYVNEQIGDIPTQVQANWTETDSSDPSYIENKPNELELVAGNNIEIAVSGTNIVISSTASAVTGLDLLYGQFTSNNVSTTATMAKTKGNINVNNGLIQLEQGKSYHVTVRGYYQQTNAANSYSPISYVEYITSNTINIDIDRSRTDAQYFELSYDLFNLNSDIDYQVAFSGGAGLVKDLVVEVHSLGGAGTGSSSGGSTIEYDPGYGINISNNVISVDSSIIPDTSTLATKAEVANVSGTIVGMIPNTSNLATKAELNSASANIIGQIPDVSNFATTTELTNACNNVISMIPDVSNLATKNEVQAVSSAIPDVSDMATQTWVSEQGYLTSIPSYYATETEVNNAIASAINTIPAQVNADWNSDSGKSEILNKPDLSVYSTHSELYNATVSAINVATANIPSQVQSDWTEDNTSDPSYIQNKPDTIDIDLCPIIAGSGISIIASGNSAILSCTVAGGNNYSAGNGIDITNNTISIDNTVALKSEIPDVSSFVTTNEVNSIVGSVSSIIENDIPDTSDMATKTWVGNQSYVNSSQASAIAEAEVSNVETVEIDLCPIIAGSNITITASGSSAVISSTGGGSTYTAGNGIDITNDEISIDNTVALKSEIPDVSNLATKTEVQTVSAAIPTLPDEEEVDFEEVDLSEYALVSAVSGKQDKLTDITDVQVVNSLPASPVATVLYLIPEA